MLRHKDARTRYWILFAASLKFLVPCAALTALGRQFSMQTTYPTVGAMLGRIAEPLAPPTVISALPDTLGSIAIVLVCLWALGCVVVLARWIVSWIRATLVARAATPCGLWFHTPVLASALMFEPGVIGVLRPVIVLPEGIAERLTPAQLDAVLAHELCHVQRRDNLTALIHTIVQSVFWFHPLVWWIGARLLEERERACDEAVLAAGSEPQTYARTILSVCRFSVESQQPCVAGVSGADLKQRIQLIMSGHAAQELNAPQKLALAVLVSAAIAVPLMAGIRISVTQDIERIYSQLRLDSARVRITPAGYAGGASLQASAGQVHMRNMSLRELISIVYDINKARVFGGPEWLDAPRYDIDARANLQPTIPVSTDPAFYRPMIEELLAGQFNLQIEERSIHTSHAAQEAAVADHTSTRF
jgi:beta-lactamase regulating signal transducer with metallopeptidase domain